MIRELIAKFNRSLTESMVSSRRNHKAPIKIWFDPDVNSDRGREMARSACVLGETVDISRSGVAFVAPMIRVKEKYLVGHERNLNVEIDLPNGKVFLQAIGRRYEKVGADVSTERFLVGMQITSLSGDDKDIYDAFLKRGNRSVRGAARGLELKAD